MHVCSAEVVRVPQSVGVNCPSQVFHDEGRSLHSMMYGHAARSGSQGGSGDEGDRKAQHAEMVQQSAWWWALRKDAKVGDASNLPSLVSA